MMETAKLLEKLRNMGTTILVVTHDSELIHACCGRKINYLRQTIRNNPNLSI